LIYYPAFDYLRIILAIAVAASHSGLIGWNQAGNYSVQVFFALSGVGLSEVFYFGQN